MLRCVFIIHVYKQTEWKNASSGPGSHRMVFTYLFFVVTQREQHPYSALLFIGSPAPSVPNCSQVRACDHLMTDGCPNIGVLMGCEWFDEVLHISAIVNELIIT